MKAKEFLDQLNPQSVVFEENICYEYTERQLVLFAELYHKHIAKNDEVLDNVMWRCSTDLFIDCRNDRVFTKGEEYEQHCSEPLTLYDDEGEEHVVTKWVDSFIAI